MGILEDLIKRAENSCELCKCEDDLDIFEVTPSDGTAIPSLFFRLSTTQSYAYFQKIVTFQH